MTALQLRVCIIIVVCLGMFSSGSEALAGSGCGSRHGDDPVARLERHAEEIGLSDAQLHEMRGFAVGRADARAELQEQIRFAYEELRALMESDPIDESAVLAQVEAIGNLKTQERIEQTRLTLAFRGFMTPEQREEMRSLRRDGRGKGVCTQGEGCDASCRHGGGEHESCAHEACKAAKNASDDKVAECPRAKAAREEAEAEANN